MSDIISKNMFIDRTTKILSKVLDFRIAKQDVIAGNLANADTPGFIPKDLPFEKELQQAVSKEDIKLKKTDPRHLSMYDNITDQNFDPSNMIVPEGKPNELNLDKEMAKMAENNLLYEASVKLLSRRLDDLKTVITGGGN